MKDNLIIFYVDDDPEDLDVFAETAISAGVDVVPLSDSDDIASNVLKADGRDKVIFVDINMPAKSGFDLLKELRQSDDLKKLPIVAFSTGHDAVTIKKCWDFGADLFIRKGSSLEQYREILTAVEAIDWSSFTRDPKAFVLKVQPKENQA